MVKLRSVLPLLSQLMPPRRRREDFVGKEKHGRKIFDQELEARITPAKDVNGCDQVNQISNQLLTYPTGWDLPCRRGICLDLVSDRP
jgi:hypothetical protein